MHIPTDYFFHLLNETKKQFAPRPYGPFWLVKNVQPSCGLLCFSTSKFDEMAKFLSAIGFVVTEGSDQLLPLFSEGRGARVKRGKFEFNLEESKKRNQLANFNMMLTDLSDEEVARAKASGYKFTHTESILGECYTFESPDCGTFVFS